MTTPHAANMSARPINPDTDNPLPSPTARQLALVDEVLLSIGQSTDPANVTRRALIEAVVREHGRILRGCLTELREQGIALDREARQIAADTSTTPHEVPVSASRLAQAADLAARAGALRTVMLRGDR